MREKILIFISDKKPWFYLLANVSMGIILAIIVFLVNGGILPFRAYLPEFLFTGTDLAETILSVLAGAWLSVTTFTFSITMVVLTTYSSHYSPRIVENFLQNKTTMRVLGTFIGGFIYNISMLFFLNKSFVSDQVISSTVGILYAFWCIIQFVIFIFSVANAIQAQNLIAGLYDEAEGSIDDYLKKEQPKRTDEVDVEDASEGHKMVADSSGHLAAVSKEEILNTLGEGEYKLVVEKRTGDFIHKGDVLAILYGRVLTEEEEKELAAFFPLEKKRYTVLDYRYGIQKLVDIVVRALSPGINDPNTAISAIHSLGMLMGSLSKIDGNYDVISEKLYVKNHPFSEDIFSIYSQIVTYAKEDLNVMIALMRALEGAAAVSSEGNLKHLDKMHKYVCEIAMEQLSHPVDREIMEQKRGNGLNVR